MRLDIIVKRLFALSFAIIPLAAVSAERSADDMLADFEKYNFSTDVANEFLRCMKEEELIEKDIKFSADVPVDSVRQQVYYWAGEWYNEQQDYPLAKEYGLKALPLYNGVSDAKADCLNLMGVVCVRTGELAAGADYIKQCLDIDILSGDPERIALSYSSLAGTYIAANDAEAAEKYALDGLKYAQKSSNTLRTTILLGMLSEANNKLGKYEKAMEYAERAFEIDSAAGRGNRAAIRLSQMANALVGMEDYEQAEATFRRSFPLLEESQNFHSLAINYNQFGFLLIKRNRHEEAADYFRGASKLFEQMGDLYNQIHSQRGLYESLWTSNPDSARIALEKFNVLKDSLYSHASANALAKYKAEFDTDRLKDEIQQTSQSRRRDLIIVCGILLVFICVGVWLYRIKMKRYRSEIQRLMTIVDNVSTLKKEAKKEEVKKSEAKRERDDDMDFERTLVVIIDECLEKHSLSVADIALRFNMSERTFRRRVLDVTGQNPKDFITAVQMKKALNLLKENSDMNITEVARLCGFDELSSFSRTFRRTFDCAPSDYKF